MGFKRKSRLERKEAFEGYLCIMPWLIGFLVLTLGPVIFSFIMSLTKWDMITPPKMVGFSNYVSIFTDDSRFRQSLEVTAVYAAFAVPLGLICSLALAMLLNINLKGMRVFRSIFYIPAILPGVAVSMVWLAVFKPQGGVLNTILGWCDVCICFIQHLCLVVLNTILGWCHIAPLACLRWYHIAPLPWLQDPKTALPSFIIMSLWGVGGGMIIYLAGLQSVPTQLYEAAEIDGAGSWSKFRNVTLPMISPTIFFNLVMGVIGSFQVFTSSFVMTQGGPANATLFYVLYLYLKAFKYLQMGYACALAWILFGIILVLTLIVFKSSASWVYYEAELKK